MSEAQTLPAAAEWQRGYDLATLKAYASVFKERHKAHVYGAFGLTKERDVADALATNALLWKRGPSGQPIACAIGKALKVAGSVTDFAARTFEVPKGHVKIGAFACLDAEAGAAVLQAVVRRGAPVWVEIFEEDATARAAVEAVPELAYVSTKIGAGSEVKGIYSTAPARPAPLHPAEQASILVVDPDFASPEDCTAMLEEADAYAAWAQHYSSYNKRHSWTAYALRGFDPEDASFIIKPDEMSQSWKAENPQRMAAKPQWTKAAERFPHTMAMVKRVLGGRDADRVRLMRLAPGGELSRHADITDREAGLADGRLCRLHLPLRTSPSVVVHGWDKRGRHVEQRFPAGALCYLDQRGPHRVENRDPNVDRVHLVCDVRSDGALRDRIAAAMA